MPELPDIIAYMRALDRCVVGHRIERVRVRAPNLLRTVDPPLAEVEGKHVIGLRRIGKRIAIACEGDIWLVIHLMIAGRLQWKPPNAKIGAKINLAAIDFAEGSLVLTEAGTRKRAALHVARTVALDAFDRGGLEPLGCDREAFATAVTLENHTLKRTLTDPRILSGIGNAYSDEILHRAMLSPVTLSQRLDDDEITRLYDATRAVLAEWIERLRAEADRAFPDKVTAFRPEMVAHGRYGKPCPRCATPIQRIRYAENETNYCPKCQTGGKLLADRVLSRLLKSDWPRTLEEMEERLAK